MPLEELLTLYGYSDVASSFSSSPPSAVGTKPPCVVDDLDNTWDRVGVASSSEGAASTNETGSTGEREEPVAGPSGTAEQQEQSKDGNATKKGGPWYRPGADPAVLARLRPVPERRSIRRLINNSEPPPQQMDNVEEEFSKLVCVKCEPFSPLCSYVAGRQ